MSPVLYMISLDYYYSCINVRTGVLLYLVETELILNYFVQLMIIFHNG